MTKQQIVIDTTALISYFSSVFNENPRISPQSIALIHRAFQYTNEVLLSIPSIVFVEIFDKWFRDEEFQAKFNAEIYELIKQAPNIEIRPIDHEILERFITLEDPNINLENHDRIILASAAVLNWSLITSDPKLHQFVERHKVIPSILG